MEHDPLPPHYSRLAVGILVLLGIVLCYFIAAPFIPALIWSSTLAVLFAPVERALRARLRSPAVSVSITISIATLLVVAPVILVSAALIDSIVEGAAAMSAFLSEERWRSAAQDYPGMSSALAWIVENMNVPQFLESVTARLQGWGANLVLGSIAGIVTLLLTFYFLFYLLRDRDLIVEAIGRLLPLEDAEYRMLTDRLKKTIFASVYGTAAVSALQGFLGGLVFWWLGLPSPVFWGVIMGLLGIVPFLGAFIVWVPAAVALALGGQWGSAIILVIWGTFIVGLIDNIIYPILVGHQLALHSVLSFIAILGGIVVFGVHGFVLGPLILAGTQSLLETLRTRMDGTRTVAPIV